MKLILTNDQNENIFKALKEIGLNATEFTKGSIQVNRTECHNTIKGHEWDIIEILNTTIKNAVDNEKYYISNGIKTDDIWTWEIYKKT